jgi:hypothetical protein
MEKNVVIIKAEDFKYPSKEERSEAEKNCPKLNSFGFKYECEIESIEVENKSIDEASKETNLYYWDICLKNRFFWVHQTYIYVLTNYNRGFLDDNSIYSDNESVNILLFNYYVEIFHYYYFSSRDIVAQILNLYFQIGTPEVSLYFNDKFFNKIKGKHSACHVQN